MSNYYIINNKVEHQMLIDAKLFAQKHIVTNCLFEASAYPFCFYVPADNSRIIGWQPSIWLKSNKQVVQGLNLLPIDILLYPEQYPEFYV